MSTHQTPAPAAEFADAGAFSMPLRDTYDGLRGPEICGPDGYVFFVRGGQGSRAHHQSWPGASAQRLVREARTE